MLFLHIKDKYIPKTLNDIIDQEQTVEFLKTIIQEDNIFPLMIFHGTYGSGKTSIANLFIRAINCLNVNKPCNKCENCQYILQGNGNDFLDIDGATNNGVEKIRFFIENAYYSPKQLKYKCILIDEVHMLTKESFNSLLKTTEYPPAKTIFIFVTTEIEKIISTIRSRALCCKLNTPSVSSLLRLLRLTEQKENWSPMEEKMALAICESSTLSYRDLLIILEKIKVMNIHTYGQLMKLTGYILKQDIYNLYSLLLSGNLQEVIKEVQILLEKGCDINLFIENLIIIINQCIIFKNTGIKESSYIEDKITKISNNTFYFHLKIINNGFEKKNIYDPIFLKVLLIELSITQGDSETFQMLYKHNLIDMLEEL